MSIEGGSFIFGRHTKRADGTLGYGLEPGETASEEYPHVTAEGVEKAQATAEQQFVPMIEGAASNSILFIGGSSEEGRTRETADIIGNQLASHYTGRNDVTVVTRNELEVLREQARSEENGSVLDTVQNIINNSTDKKLVITYPLYLKELSLRPHYRDQTGQHTEFSQQIIDKTAANDAEGTREWFKTEGTDTVPSPQEVAELQLQAVNRLTHFAEKFTDRPIQIGIVGHGWQLDALAVYLANKGHVTSEAYEETLEGRQIEQAETGTVSITPDGIVFSYRDNHYEVPPEILGKE